MILWKSFKTLGIHVLLFQKLWESFTDQIIKHINHNLDDVIFLLWGSFAKAKAKLINDKQAIARGIWGLAWISVYADVHSHDKVIDMFESGLSIYKELEDFEGLVGTYIDLGYCYLHLNGNLHKSLESV